MYCRYCGKVIPDDSLVCTYCGKRLYDEPNTVDQSSSVLGEGSPDRVIRESVEQQKLTYDPFQNQAGEAVVPQKKKSRTVILIVGIAAVVLTFFLIFFVLGRSDTLSVKDVKKGHLVAYDGKTIGEAFDGFFKNGKWEDFISDDPDKLEIVQYVGYDENNKEFIIQFYTDENMGDSEFAIYASRFDGEMLSDKDLRRILADVYGVEVGALDVDNVKEGYLDGHEDITIGAALDNYFSDGTWKAFVAEDEGLEIVEYIGYDRYGQEFGLQFAYSDELGDDVDFVVYTAKIDDKLLTDSEISGLLASIYNGEDWTSDETEYFDTSFYAKEVTIPELHGRVYRDDFLSLYFETCIKVRAELVILENGYVMLVDPDGSGLSLEVDYPCEASLDNYYSGEIVMAYGYINEVHTGGARASIQFVLQYVE